MDHVDVQAPAPFDERVSLTTNFHLLKDPALDRRIVLQPRGFRSLGLGKIRIRGASLTVTASCKRLLDPIPALWHGKHWSLIGDRQARRLGGPTPMTTPWGRRRVEAEVQMSFALVQLCQPAGMRLRRSFRRQATIPARHQSLRLR